MRGVSGLVGLVNKLLGKKSYGGEVAHINRMLPVEILEKIFRLLPHRDLKVGPWQVFKKFHFNEFGFKIYLGGVAGLSKVEASWGGEKTLVLDFYQS